MGPGAAAPAGGRGAASSWSAKLAKLSSLRGAACLACQGVGAPAVRPPAGVAAAIGVGAAVCRAGGRAPGAWGGWPGALRLVRGSAGEMRSAQPAAVSACRPQSSRRQPAPGSLKVQPHSGGGGAQTRTRAPCNSSQAPLLLALLASRGGCAVLARAGPQRLCGCLPRRRRWCRGGRRLRGRPPCAWVHPRQRAPGRLVHAGQPASRVPWELVVHSGEQAALHARHQPQLPRHSQHTQQVWQPPGDRHAVAASLVQVAHL